MTKYVSIFYFNYFFINFFYFNFEFIHNVCIFNVAHLHNCASKTLWKNPADNRMSYSYRFPAENCIVLMFCLFCFYDYIFFVPFIILFTKLPDISHSFSKKPNSFMCVDVTPCKIANIARYQYYWKIDFNNAWEIEKKNRGHFSFIFDLFYFKNVCYLFEFIDTVCKQ